MNDQPVRAFTWTSDTPTCAPGATASRCAPSALYLPGNLGLIPNPSYPYLQESLFVFLPATGGKPSENSSILRMAAYAGYRTIGLSYTNTNEIGGPGSQCEVVEGDQLCKASYADECAYKIRKERLTGVDNSTTVQALHPKDSIAYRLVHILQQAVVWDLADGINDWNFGQYCNTLACTTGGNMPWMDRIRWDKVVLGGFSQGAGFGMMLSLETAVAGHVAIDGGNDRCITSAATGVTREATYYKALGSIQTPLGPVNTGGASPGPGEFAALHEDDLKDGLIAPEVVPDSYPYVQLGTTVTNIDTAPGVPTTTVTVKVARTKQSYVIQPNGSGSAHGSMARDTVMPTQATALPPTTPVSSGYPPDLNLFKTYVRGFCSAQ